MSMFIATLLFAGCADAGPPIEVAAQYPHDERAFTEGLLFHDGELYESTGQYGASSVRRVDPVDGRVLAWHRLPARYFGEGLAVYDDKLYQLTWKAGVGFVYNVHSLKPIGRFHYDGQGWGLTACGDRLVMSNGSDMLTFRDPGTFAVTRRLRVTDHGRPLEQINELETIHGLIWANVWLTDRIVIIDPTNGEVVAALDGSDLAGQQPPSANVFNGIAYDAARDRIFVTGKYWPMLYVLANNSRQAPRVPAADRCPPAR